jgi:hypothetical protein
MEIRQRRSFTDDYKRQAVDLMASSGRSIGSVALACAIRCCGAGWNCVELGGSRWRRRGAPQRRRRRSLVCSDRTNGCVWSATFSASSKSPCRLPGDDPVRRARDLAVGGPHPPWLRHNGPDTMMAHQSLDATAPSRLSDRPEFATNRGQT